MGKEEKSTGENYTKRSADEVKGNATELGDEWRSLSLLTFFKRTVLGEAYNPSECQLSSQYKMNNLIASRKWARSQ